MDENSRMSDFGDGTPEPEASGSNSGTVKPSSARACDYCRQRKAGCSREKPQCRNCKNAKRLCTYTDPVLRKENPTVKISGQLSTLGSRLSRIESILPSLKPLSPSSHSSTSAESSEATLERLNKIEHRIDGFDAKLDSIHGLLAGLARFANKAAKASDMTGAPILHSQIQRRWSTAESDSTAHDSLEDDLAVGDPLFSDDNGNTQYLGRSSNYSFTADAEMLVQSRLRGMKQNTKGSARDPEQANREDINSNRPNKAPVEDEEDANPLSGMAIAMGDFHTGVDAAHNRERTTSIENAPRPLQLIQDPPPRVINEAEELAGIGGNKNVGDYNYYIPNEEERQFLLNSIYTHLASEIPLFSNIPPAPLIALLFESPSKFLTETDYDKSWVTIGYCLAFYSLCIDGFTTCDVEQRRKGFILKRAMSRNAWASFKDLELFLTPSIEHVQALILLSILAQDTSRPGLCWMLTCQACRLAQAMGLHRRVDPNSHGLSEHDIEFRKYLFWILYILDKSFSLSFGRTSCFQDYDCDVEVPKRPTTPPSNRMAPLEVVSCFLPEYFGAMVELAKLQSAVYKKLYSARASTNKGRSRTWVKETEKWVWELDSRLRMWKESLIANLTSKEFSKFIPETSRHHEDVVIAMEHMEFSYHTLMTMIHRRLFRPASEEYDDGEVVTSPNTRKRSRNILLHSARSAIHVVRKLGEHNNYMKTKWLILYHPFAPFFVLFSKIVTSPRSPTNELDVELMHQVGAFLQRVRASMHVSNDDDGIRDDEEDGVVKFLTVVNAFIRVAKSFMKRDKERMIKAKAEREPREKAQGGNAAGSIGSNSPKIHLTNNVQEIVEAVSHIYPTSNSTPGTLEHPPSPSVTRNSPHHYSSSQLHPHQQQQHPQQPMQPLHHSPAQNECSPYPPDPSPQNTFVPQTPLGYDCGQVDFVHWNSTAAAQSMMSINQLQDLASMDVDMTMGVEALYQDIPYPEVMDGQVSGRVGGGGGQNDVIDNGLGEFSGGVGGRLQQGGAGVVGNNYMEMFETAVRQGAMDFDWINWDV